MAAVFISPPTSLACINLMRLHLLFLFCTHGIWFTTGLGKSHYCGGYCAITNYISMELRANKLRHILRHHLQVGLSGVNVANMATKCVDLPRGGGVCELILPDYGRSVETSTVVRI